MTKIEICGKEYKIYFGYKATVQNGIIKKLVKMSEIADQMEAVEETLNVLPGAASCRTSEVSRKRIWLHIRRRSGQGSEGG